MSLWHKAIETITFQDIDAFCRTAQPEGLRLDYKAERPKELAKLIAAFANTLGGLIILGVDSDKTTNQPIWPPTSRGMAAKPGEEEAITAIARDAIYPPVRIGVSPIIENELLPEHSLVVIRVDESKDAPHAVEDGRKIYERGGSMSHPILYARLDRIAYLLERRRRIEEEREEIRSHALARSLRLISDSLKPIVSLSVIPIYPWRDLCRPSTCYAHFRFSSLPAAGSQRIPGGGIFLWHITLPNIGNVVYEVLSCDAKGHFLDVRSLVGIGHVTSHAHKIIHQSELSENEFSYLSVKERINIMIAQARAFYQRSDVERPGLLSLQLGIRQTMGIKIYTTHPSYGISKPFIDNEYHDDITLSVEEFLTPGDAIERLFDRIAFSFDISTPDTQ